MILQSLCNYYARMIKDPQSGMPRPGFSTEKISYALSLNPDGALAGVLDLRVKADKKLRPRLMSVPAAVKRASNVAPNFLWDNTGYVLGVDGKGKAERTASCFAAFKELHAKAAQDNPQPGLLAVIAFLEAWNPADFDDLTDIDPQEMRGDNCVFMWEETGDFIHDDPDISKPSGDEVVTGRCLVSGEYGPIARLHSSIKGVWGGQSTGASIVSFNASAFISYGKEQSFNAPVCEKAATAYTSALNYLLNRDNRRCIQVGDASTVFWAETTSRAEDLFLELLDARAYAEKREDGESVPETTAAGQVEALLGELVKGVPIEKALPDIDPDVRFFILGLAPNAARISIRFWLVSDFGRLAANIARHQADIAIERQYENEPLFPPYWRMLLATAALGKSENVLPPLASGLFRSILEKTPYPQALLAAVIGRIRADQTVTHPRAAAIKGYLVRNLEKEISPMLDEAKKDLPYLLGRLFALLEKAQADALGKINKTIRDNYIGSASTTPAVVFPRLLHLAQYHIAKSEYGGVTDRRIQDVMQSISGFPAHLKLEDQGLFFIGYYHQRNANYQKTAKQGE
ncbi:MAG: type I-C CRISPR-associated protein Cas8c/Csd1 [Desulfovibrio sp.]|jgi:CRISPR-associated protein Csd1|nr:type I-C CRISPR-associated protein Cas8c/Csd1 [Desulfovibrio sp.]